MRDGVGRPCLDIEAAARSHAINQKMFDHVVSIKNNCPRKINVRVCYYGSDKCNAIDLLGYKRVDTILGTMTGIKVFRYVIYQK